MNTLASNKSGFLNTSSPKIGTTKIDINALVPSFVFQSLIENAWLLSLENSKSKPKITISTETDSVRLQIDITSSEHIHTKVEAKVTLALNRLDLLKESDLIHYDLNWSKSPFMTLTIHTH